MLTRGYTTAGDHVELSAMCRCGRAVKAADVELGAGRLSIVCPRCHEIVLRIDLPEAADDEASPS
jgi:hypothetical protein